jgi:DNA-binding transcriptional MerR regulator
MDLRGRYRIQAVSRMTGVPAATLRAWERRYGVPEPSRTRSSYRLYGEMDVDAVRRMRDLCAQGVPASEAARQVKQLLEAPQDDAGDPFLRASDRFVQAVLDFQPSVVEQEVRRLFTLGPAAMLYERAVSPALGRIGELWAAGRLSVAQEHLASGILEGSLRSTLRLVQPPEPERTMVIGCFADEEHGLGIYGVGFRMAAWGITTVDLGPRTPPGAIAEAVTALRPSVVGLSVTLRPERARELVDEYAEAVGDTPWIVGGSSAGQIRKYVEKRGGFCFEGEMAGLRAPLDRMIRRGRG